MTQFINNSSLIYSYGLSLFLVQNTSIRYKLLFLTAATKIFFGKHLLQKEKFSDPKIVGLKQYEILKMGHSAN